ncbi:conserved Plasmodium protein, unknown function [Plasmodium berghei]|uniref:Uncharacterized protein n=2 Tax=Plasmodium berghei TaxID=5821 RepID=A0A509AHA3_PLABA|nr:conserved Plasmodium protein, unknown function [Plasmodium berghei ANKA]CXH89039.1 conserved Plasmodium protein, unknown function [Plasmodium berghei]SCL90282.1 conserved Plasmodium protein, unknown function [Plasmodium berghei]SCM15259.1 conserved Plasmodium protein, unknown function [Plasmodium berghei]SCM17054.1 conserved Plasmodium protein, unknown function [Plasmodium berghei]SCN21941.1 conserved Plasmodium protein, unknown function [Plasmodium berghei]|eukprot:XP_034419834.1 conserved Plasmodium protein, unknown function [Plasmodium berghei ANKA]
MIIPIFLIFFLGKLCEGYVLNLIKGRYHNFIIPNTKYAEKKQTIIKRHVFRSYMKRLRNATVEIDIENRKDLTKIEIIKMFLKGVRECKNVEILKEKAKGHVPLTTKRKLMKQKRMINLRNHIKNDRIKKQEYVNPNQNILNFPKNQIKNINAAVLYFKHYFGKYENNAN